jgi:nucleotide-binding universal stress UspA family protein
MTAVEIITTGLEEKAAALAPYAGLKSIVVATDGSDSALPAFKTASLIQEHTGAEVHVLSVIELLSTLIPSPEGLLLSPEFDKARRDAQRAIVDQQVKQFADANKWTVDIKLGRPGETIATFAREEKADVIIVGSNKHGTWGRILGEETAAEIARLSSVPLFVASPGIERLPRRVLVAMDLNPEGMQCAPQVLSWLTEKQSISCVHVMPRSEFLGIDWTEFDSDYELAMRERFNCLNKEMRRFDLKPELVVLHGDAAHELTDFASYAKAELVVVGVKRRSGRARAVGGRMAGRILRQAECSVLIVPNLIPQTLAATTPADTTAVIHNPALWDEALKQFTARNAGRMVKLEVDDPEVGALVEAANYPLLGTDYDHRNGLLTITLGNTRGLDHHLSRAISNPESVAMLSIRGRDTAMSVSHASGQTLLTFTTK